MNRFVQVIGVLSVSVMLFAHAEAAMVMPLNVEEMARRADKIFVGTCLKVEREVNAQGIPVLTVTFAVSEGLKGAVGNTVTFQQLDPTPQQPANPRVRSMWSAAALAGVPMYSPGEEALLFLARAGKLGLTAPIGLFQGKLPVTTTPAGKKRITNSALKKTQLTAVPLPAPGKDSQYEQFVAAIRAMARPAQAK